MEKTLRWLPPKPQPRIVRYASATLLVALCFGLMRWVQADSGSDSFFLMYPAIFLSALLFDRGSGFIATGLSTVLIVVSIYEPGGPIVPESYWLPIGLFLVIGLGLAALSEILRKGWERAIDAERAKDLLTGSFAIAPRMIWRWPLRCSISKPALRPRPRSKRHF